MYRYFTSESVSEGHPDKLADQISDGLLDSFLEVDSSSRVALETLVTTGLVIISGETSSQANIVIDDKVRDVIRRVGYTKNDYQFSADSCGILSSIQKQSSDIALGVNNGGAGDQGLMFGFAIDETSSYMPFSFDLARRLMIRLSHIRKNTSLMPYLGPDSKSQITVEYHPNGKPFRIDSLVLSCQHDDGVEQEQIKEDLWRHVFSQEIKQDFLDENLKLFVNSTGKFVIGGPYGDTGLTGRKIVVDTYGGHAPHGGGAFSGKDPTKVDRSGAYMARYIAKHIVALGLAKKCIVQLAYAIGVAEPISLMLDTFGTSKYSNEKLIKATQMIFDCTPKAIIERFQLCRPIYEQTARQGHFGYDYYPWEKLNLLDELDRIL